MAGPKRILVTGPTGFVGSGLVPHLRGLGLDVLPVGRAEIGSIGEQTDWRPHLDQDVDTVIHLAGRAHVMRETERNPIDAYRRINLMGTAQLVRQASGAGVRRFIFLSTAKVMGEGGPVYTRDDEPAPQDPYAVSKAEAEFAVRDLSGPMGWVILRPPLVYGPGVKGNFLSLLRAVDRGVPLPLGGVRNARSLISLGNLMDAVRHGIDGPEGAFLPSDGEDLSTPQLVRRLAAALGRPARLVPVPPALLRGAGLVTGKMAAVDRLLGDFTVDGAIPGWSPPQSVDEGLQEVARWYRGLAGS